jgi:amino acid permease
MAVTEKQFDFFCRTMRVLSALVFFLQALACVVLLWMFLHDLPRRQDFMMFLGVSIFASLMLWSRKKTFYRREEVKMGTWGNTGIMHPFYINFIFWFLYFYFELFFVACAFWIYSEAIRF